MNAEKYKDAITENEYYFGIDIYNNNLLSCKEIRCANCKFYGHHCNRNKVEWLLQECQESIPEEPDEEKEREN